MNLADYRRDLTISLNDARVASKEYYFRRKGQRKWYPFHDCIGFIPFERTRVPPQRQAFYTGLCDLSAQFAEPIFSKDWHIDFRIMMCHNENEERFKFLRDAATIRGHEKIICEPLDVGFGKSELIIFAPSKYLADDLLMNINAANLLFSGYSPREVDETSTSLTSPLLRTKEYTHSGSVGIEGIYSSAVWVSRAWDSEQSRRALARLWHSTRIFYRHPLDAHPRYGQDFLDQHFDFHYTAYALAIVAAYSAIEELGFVPRKKGPDPIWSGGKWSPTTRHQLEAELRKRNVDVKTNVNWIFRGPVTPIENEYKPELFKVPTWHNGRVRDLLISITDAILISSAIRNRIAAHETKALTKLLSVNDLTNVQSTVKTLLLALWDMDWLQSGSIADYRQLEFRKGKF